MKTKVRPAETEQDGETRDLRVVLKTDFGTGCPLNTPPANVADIELQLTENGCQIDFTINGDGPGEGYRVEHLVKEFDEACGDFSDCVCCIFRRYDCVPNPLGYHGDGIYVATYLPDRETGSALISDLREVCSFVRLVQITENDEGTVSQIKEVDMAQLSDKQKEALRLALEGEYFGPGPGVTLFELAEDMDITSSALSQRITRAEAAILKQLFE